MRSAQLSLVMSEAWSAGVAPVLLLVESSLSTAMFALHVSIFRDDSGSRLICGRGKEGRKEDTPGLSSGLDRVLLDIRLVHARSSLEDGESHG